MDIRIQHIKIIKKSDVPHIYQEMLLTFTFNENLTSLKEQIALFSSACATFGYKIDENNLNKLCIRPP